MDNIIVNIRNLEGEILQICKRINRNPKDIIIVAVAKTFTDKHIMEALKGGITDIGENKVQEAKEKFLKLKERNIIWHMVGYLQRNKVKDALEIFDLIHSVDSLRLAEEIEKRARAINKRQKILVEVNISGEISKHGLRYSDVLPFVEKTRDFPHIKVKGLMTIAPFYDNSEKCRPIFRQLKELKEKIQREKFEGVKMDYLSMGMTNDYQVALEEGADMLRIGRKIFGRRGKNG